MAIALYPYSTYTVFVGGGPVVLLNNDIEEADFFAVTLQFQQSTFAPQPTLGTLTFTLKEWDPAGNVRKECVCVTLLQSIQTRTFVRDVAIVRLEVTVTSDFEADRGIPAVVILQSLVQGAEHPGEVKKVQQQKPNKNQNRNKKTKGCSSCVCAKCLQRLIAKIPCPVITLDQLSLRLIGAQRVTGSGINIMFLNTKSTKGCGMIPLLKTAVVTQAGVSGVTVVEVQSATNFAVRLNVLRIPLVLGPLTLQIFPTNPACPSFTFNLILTP